MALRYACILFISCLLIVSTSPIRDLCRACQCHRRVITCHGLTDRVISMTSSVRNVGIYTLELVLAAHTDVPTIYENLIFRKFGNYIITWLPDPVTSTMISNEMLISNTHAKSSLTPTLSVEKEEEGTQSFDQSTLIVIISTTESPYMNITTYNPDTKAPRSTSLNDEIPTTVTQLDKSNASEIIMSNNHHQYQWLHILLAIIISLLGISACGCIICILYKCHQRTIHQIPSFSRCPALNTVYK